MLVSDILKELINKDGLNQSDVCVLCIAHEQGGAKRAKDIVEIACNHGLPEAAKWNVARALRNSEKRAVKIKQSWELSRRGREWVKELAGPLLVGPIGETAPLLREQLSKISSHQTRSFVSEAIACFETRQHRAAVVLSWVGAMSVLHTQVATSHLAEFNREAKKRNAKWKIAKNTEDLTRMQERDFLEILPAISLVGKTVKAQLVQCLDLRNGCGHPNNLEIADHSVSSHIEKLILNVFSKFG
ncbi:MAG: hypothetical protein AAGH99_06320 [Planctomycetota bacterium]